MFELVNRVRRASQSLVQELGRGPTMDEIARELDVAKAKVETAIRCMRQPMSLDAPLGAENDATLADMLEDRRAPSPLDEAIQSALATQTERLLEIVSPREAKVLRMRFGIGGRGEHTLEEVGERLHRDPRAHSTNRVARARAPATPHEALEVRRRMTKAGGARYVSAPASSAATRRALPLVASTEIAAAATTPPPPPPPIHPAAAAGALRALLGLVHAEGAALERRAVHRRDGLARLVRAAHRHEAEAARPAGLAIGHDVHVGDRRPRP